MIALDLKLEGAIDRLGPLKDGRQDELSPQTGWGHEFLDLRERQFAAVQAGGANLNGPIRDAIEAFKQRPLFQWVLSQLPPPEEDLGNIVLEATLNGLLANQATGASMNISALSGGKGVLLATTNRNDSGFDPENYIKQKKGWFLRDGIQTERGTIQRGRGFQMMSEARSVCAFFETLEPGQLTTGLFIPASLQSYDLFSSAFWENLDRTSTARYIELGEAVHFDFSNGGECYHRPPSYPNMSLETRARLMEQLRSERPELVRDLEIIERILEVRRSALFRDYLNPENHLLTEEELARFTTP